MSSFNSKLKSDILKVTGGCDETMDFDESTSPSILHEVTLDPLSSSNDGSTGPTMKDYEAQLTHLKKENFNLKLRIYFLEERLGPYRGGSEKEDPFKKNIELKVETETLRKELAENQQLLRDAAGAMDHMEKQHEVLKKLMEDEKSEKSQLQLEIERMKKEYEALLERPNHENSAAMYAFAFGMPELLKPNSVSDKETEVKLQQKIKELESQVQELQSQLNQEKNVYKQLELELTSAKTEKEELDQEVERFSSQIDEMKEKLGERDQELEEARKQVSNLEEALMAKEPEIRIKVQELAERDKMIDEANSKLEAKEKVLVEIQITLDEKQKQIEALRASLASKDEAIAGLRSKLANSESAAQEFQDKMKQQWMEGMSLTPKQLIQFEKNVLKRRPNTYRNHNRGITEVSNGGSSYPTKRPDTAPLPGKGIEVDDQAILKLREELERWRKKAEEAKKETEEAKKKTEEAKKKTEEALREVQLKDEMVKNRGFDEGKMKRALQAITARSKEFEKEVEKCKQELRRKEKKIRDLLCELTVAHDQVNKAKWEGANGVGAGRQHAMGLGFSTDLDDVKDMADEENERLWAELDDKTQKLKQLTDEKNTVTVEFNNKIQAMMSVLKEKEEGLSVLEEKNNSLALQLADKIERVKTLEAQALTMESLGNVNQRPSGISSLSEWVSQQKNLNSSSFREVLSVHLSSTSEEHSFLHSHIQKLQRNLRNTPERERGPRGPLEEAEEARHEAEEVRTLLGGHLWELAVFLEGLLEETNLSLSESHKSSLRRALEWSRELSLSVLSTTGLADQSDRDCTRTSLAVLREFPSFCACVTAPESLESSKKLGISKESIRIEEIEENPNQEVSASRQDSGSLCVPDPNVSVESLHSSVEALHCRVRELEREVGGKSIDLREGSSEVGRGCNSGESVKTVRNARPSTLTIPQAGGSKSVVSSKQDVCVDGGVVNCTIASPSESEGWSEPDRTVSLARMGLEEMVRSTASATVVSAAQQSTAESGGSLVETRTPSKRSHGEVRRLQNRLRGLEQVIEALRAELRVYHSVTPVTPLPVVGGLQETPRQNNVALELGQGDHEGPSTRDAEVNTTMGVQSEPVDTGGLGHLLEEVRCQRDKLEYSLKQNELIGQQLETVLSGLRGHQKEDGLTNLCHKLKDATDRLEEEQARCRDLQSQLVVARSSLLTVEAKLQESQDMELKLRVLLNDKETQLQNFMSVGKIKETNEMENSEELNIKPKKEVCPTKEDIKMPLLEEKSGCMAQANISATKSSSDQGDVNLDSSEPGCNNSSRKILKLGESSIHETQKGQCKSFESIRFNAFVNERTLKALEETEAQNQNVSVNGTAEVPCKFSDSSSQASILTVDQESSAELVSKMESEMFQMRNALKEAKERVCLEEIRARKAEADAHHWMEVAKEQERIAKLPAAVVHVTEDPSEGSSSSALSGILTDLTRQHSEMSDYISDQTGGEDSEPSLHQLTNPKRSSCGRPGIIPLEVSSAGTYLSPPTDISPTFRHDAFSSPDLGIESDPGRFSSLENPPKTPEEVRNGAIKFSDIHSSAKSILYAGSLAGNVKLSGSHLSRSGKSADNLSVSCLNDLRLENEHLRQSLAETRKNLDETMSKLEAANRRKVNVEKAICNQLQKTHHILRKARVNLGADLRE